MCLDVTKGEPFNKDVVLPRTYTDDNKLLKKVKDIVDTDDVKAVHIVKKEEIETMYGMSEQDFINSAKVLDPATRKALAQETTSEE